MSPEESAGPTRRLPGLLTATFTWAVSEGAAGDEERNALHRGTTQTHGESGKERRDPTGAEEVSRI